MSKALEIGAKIMYGKDVNIIDEINSGMTVLISDVNKPGPPPINMSARLNAAFTPYPRRQSAR